MLLEATSERIQSKNTKLVIWTELSVVVSCSVARWGCYVRSLIQGEGLYWYI